MTARALDVLGDGPPSAPSVVAVPSFAGCFGPARPAESAPRAAGRAAILHCYQPPAADVLETSDPARGSRSALSVPTFPLGTAAAARERPIACRRVAILCINPWNYAGPLQPFSYAAFRVQASLVVDPRFAGVEVRVFEGRDWDAQRWVDEVLAFDPDVIGASAYVWSLPALLPVLRHVKRVRPDVCTVLGGPSARVAMLDHAPYRGAADYVDALVVSDDETAFADVAARWPCDRAALAAVPGIAVADGAGFRVTPGTRRRRAPDERPSPSQLGLTPPGLSGHLQTFSGCPMSCTFCAWGLDTGRGGAYSEAYLTAELEALRRAGARSVMSVDAGLNLHRRAFANLAVAESRAGLLREVPYYVEVYPARLNDALLAFLAETRAEVGVGLQSFSGETLALSDRRCHLDEFEQVIERLQRVAATTVELILGLPGDTPQAFRATLQRALSLGCGVRVYYCLVLPDALMTRAPASFALRYDPISLELRSCMTWSEDELRREVDALCELVAARGGISLNQWQSSPGAAALSERGEAIAAGQMWFFPPEPP